MSTKKAKKAKKSEVAPKETDTGATPEKEVKTVDVDKGKIAKNAEKKLAKEKASVEAKQEWLLGDPMETKKLISCLSREAILVKIRISAWRGTGSDADIAKEIAGNYNGSVDGFSVSLKMLPVEMRKELVRRIKYMQDYVLLNTLPMSEGWRLLASCLYPSLKTKVEEARLQVLDYIKQMASDVCYKQIHEYAERVLGKAYDATKIPTQAEILKKFKVEFSHQAVTIPTKLEGLKEADMEELQKEMVDEYGRKYTTAIMSLLEGLSETLEKLIEKLEGSQDRDEYKMVLRMAEARIREIQVLDVFKSNKIKNALARIDSEILDPLRRDVQELKKNDGKRKEMVKTVKKVKKDLFDEVV